MSQWFRFLSRYGTGSQTCVDIKAPKEDENKEKEISAEDDLFFDEEETEKPPKVGDTVSVINEMTNAAAPVELPQSKISSNNTSSVAISAPITINAAPGMSAEDVAAAVQTELNNRENQATRRTRSANYD